MDRYPWLNVIYQKLIKYYTTGYGHYALLFHSSSDNSDDFLVYALSCWLLCQKRKTNNSCAQCHSCRLMFAENHPDFYRVVPEKGKNSVSIEVIRQVIEKLHSHAQQGAAKVIWISQAELLTESAVNALMKVLEEPPEKTHFFLSCREPFQLFATLRSRCLCWKLFSPDKQISMKWLSRHKNGERVDHITALHLNNGSPIAAEQLLKPERWQQRSALCSALNTALLQYDMLLLLPFLNHLNVGERLHWLCALLVDAIKWQQGASNYILNQDQKKIVHHLATRMSYVSLMQIVKRLFVCRYHLINVVGINCELILTEQLLTWEKMLNSS